MTRRWQQKPQPITAKLARIALRAQRMLLLHRIEQVRVLIQTHAPDLQQTPNGMTTLTQLNAKLDEIRRHLQETSVG
jgi:hypothetical protein